MIRADGLSSDVAEIQGLYGAFSFPEKLLQKIWLRRAFDLSAARTTDGRRVHLLHPGKWNLLGGPDFRVARVRFEDGREVVGDVELHLRAADWDAHKHARDPAYNNVILHVVLFWPEPGYVSRGCGGREIPTLPLLPFLYQDLEEYAADEAVESLNNRPTARLTNELAVFPRLELKAVLTHHAGNRWNQKVHFARLRIQRLGWEEACHQSALEVLGYRYNRVPMLRVAARWPFAAWAQGRVDIEAALLAEIETWSVQGVRPANHPRTRLRQYASWALACPAWPAALLEVAKHVPELDDAELTREMRRKGRLAELRDRLRRDIGGAVLGGTRFENLVCDAFLPLLAARAEQRAALRGAWFHWFCGDVPPFVSSGLRQLAVCDGREQPMCHGLAQGLLGWLIERELRH